MADSELAQKLAKRLAVADSSTDKTNNLATTSLPNNEIKSPETTSNVSAELQNKLTRRTILNDGDYDAKTDCLPSKAYQTIYMQFPEFSRKQLKQYEGMFKRFDENEDGFLCLDELKRMFETLGCPQTHLGMKKLISDVDEDQDGKINYREFFLIFRKASSGELSSDDSISVLAHSLNEIDVHETGVKKAQQFFDAKVAQLTKLNEFEAEIKQEQEAKKRELEEKKLRRLDFQSKLGVFSS